MLLRNESDAKGRRDKKKNARCHSGERERKATLEGREGRELGVLNNKKSLGTCTNKKGRGRGLERCLPLT